MGDLRIRRYVLLTNLVMFAIAASLAWLYNGVVSLEGAIVGTCIALVNLFTLTWLVGRLIASAGGQSKAVYGLLLTLKMGAVLGVIAFVILVMNVDIVGLLLGLSSVVTSLIIGGLLASLAGNSTEASPDDAV